MRPTIGAMLALAAVSSTTRSIAQAAELGGYWITQDQNISCAVVDNKLRCDVAKHSWKPWACQENGCYGNSFVIPSKGKAVVIRSRDTTWNPNASVIGNGKSFSINGITCQAKADQLTCSNNSGGRMILSSNTYTLNR
jgi:hypothetical protein